MTSIHGKDAIIYLSPGSGAASAVSEQNTYNIDADFDLAETTELGDTWKTFVKGVNNWSGKIEGNFNTAANQLWSAHMAQTPCNFYLYPQRATAGRYYYGTCWVKLGTVIAGGIADKAKTSVMLTGDADLTPI